MHAEDLLDQLADLARAAAITVRVIDRSRDGERETRSGACLVNGEVWVMLSPAESIEERVDVLAAALATHAADFLEARYLPPAIRARIDAAREGG
jgi:hypothetical protein